MSGFPKGWIIGQSTLGSISKRKKEEAGNEIADIPAGIHELAELLRKHPVAIHVRNSRTHIQESLSWSYRNWKTSQQISKLVYFNPEVFEYLENHPEEIITGKNIIPLKEPI